LTLGAAAVGVASLCAAPGPAPAPNGGERPSTSVGTPVRVPVQDRQCALRAPVVDSATPDAAVTTMFDRYAATTPRGWTGGDATYSVRLPDGRVLWMFSDTFLGPLNRDGTRPANAPLVNNTFVVQDGGELRTVTGGTAASPTAVLPPAGDNRWYWVGDGQVVGGQAQVVFQGYRRYGPAHWQFTLDRNVVAMFAPGELATPTSVDPLPSLSGVAWGAALLPASASGDGYTYVYGMGGAPIGNAMRVARVRGDDLRQRPWWYYTPSGWTQDERAATDVLPSIANEYSVTPWHGQFLLVTQDSTQQFSSHIDALSACSPWGPFANRVSAYRMPEPGARGTYRDSGVVGYNAHVHAEFSDGDSLLVSYNVHNVDRVDAVYRDPSIYRPRFVRLRLR
jgi:hypothetical protein